MLRSMRFFLLDLQTTIDLLSTQRVSATEVST